MMNFIFQTLIGLITLSIFMGCLEIQPTNPYDPQSPLTIQFKGKIKGRFYSQEVSDLGDKTYQLQLNYIR